MRSIRTKIILLLIAVLLVTGIGVGTGSLTVTSRGLQDVIQANLPEATGLAAELVKGRVSGYLSALEVLADNPQIEDASSPWEEKKMLLLKECKRAGWVKIGYANPQGQNITTLNDTVADVNDREFFQAALKGSNAISDPIISKVDGSLVVNFAVPVKVEDRVVAVLIGSRDGNELSDLIKDIRFKTTGKAFMVNTQGVTVAHTNPELVKNKDNIIESAKEKPALSELAAVIQKMAGREPGLSTYIYNGVKKVVAFQPVEGTQWSIAIGIDYEDAYSAMGTARRQLIIFISLALLMAVLAGIIFAGRLIRPLRKIVDLIHTTANFNLANNTSYDSLVAQKDEIGIIARAMRDLRKALREILSGIGASSNTIMEHGESLAAATNESAAAMEEVARAVEEVAKGASEQAKESQNGAQMLMELSDEIDIADKKSSDIFMAAGAVNKANAAGKDCIHGLKVKFQENTEISTEMTQQVSRLAEHSASIHKIVDTIKSIADQTNLLSLNAAIEAARAGESGKGFAVVADEIRKLANETALSTKEISNIVRIIQDNIMDTKSNVDKAADIVQQSNQSLLQSEQAMDLIEEATLQAIEQLDILRQSMQRVNHAKDGVVAVMQEISAISEESAASAEQVSASVEEQSATIDDIASTADTLKEVAVHLKEAVDTFVLQ